MIFILFGKKKKPLFIFLPALSFLSQQQNLDVILGFYLIKSPSSCPETYLTQKSPPLATMAI